MSQWINKQFKNNATTPIVVQVSALADGLPFAPIQLSDRITQIIATGGTMTFSDDGRAEAHRMRRWIEHHFIGKTAAEFYAHNGTVPSAEEMDEQHMAKKRIDLPQPEINIVNTIDFSPEAVAEAMKGTPGIIERILRRDFQKGDRKKGHDYFGHAPRPGTYWQDRTRPARFFRVLSKSECANGDHTHVHMHRVDNMRGGEYDFVFTTPAKWDTEWKQVSGAEVPGNPYAAASSVVFADEGRVKVSFGGGAPIEAADLTDVQIDQLVQEHGRRHAGLRSFITEQREKGQRIKRKIGRPRALGEGYGSLAESYRGVPYTPAEPRPGTVEYRGPVDALRSKPGPFADPMFANWLLDGDNPVPKYMQQLLDAVQFTGKELPPSPGERYHSYISGQTYTIIDVRPKHESTDLYVTMERDGDGHRTKFTYRDHATWLTVWRPLDDEDKPRRVAMVDLELRLDTKDASEAIRKVGENMHAAAEAATKFNTGYTLNRITKELDKHVPNWRLQNASGPEVSFGDLMIRAIRSLNKHMLNYQQIANTFGDRDEKHVAQIAELVKAKNHFQTRTVDLEHELKIAKERYPLPAIGSVWRNKKTDSYQTVTHLFQGSAMARMKTGRNTDFDTTVENLFQNYVLVTGPELNMAALGEFKCNAYGLHQQQVILKDMIAGSVFNVNAYSMSHDGQVTIQGVLTKREV